MSQYCNVKHSSSSYLCSRRLHYYENGFQIGSSGGQKRLTADPSLKELLFFLDTTSRFCTMEPSMPVLATKDDGWIFWSVTALVAMATVLFYFL